MKIQHQETGSKGEVFVEQENERVAEMTYSWAGVINLLLITLGSVSCSVGNMWGVSYWMFWLTLPVIRV